MAITMAQEIADSKVNSITERLKQRNEATDKDDDIQPTSMLELIIDMTMKNPNCLTETEVVDHLITLVGTVLYLFKSCKFNLIFHFKAQDTQSSTIAFTLMLLGMHPTIQVI